MSGSVAGGLLFVGQMNAHLTALDVATGRVVWQIRVEESVLYSPLVVDGVAYAPGESRTLMTLDAATGETRWFLDLGQAPRMTPAFSDGLLAVGKTEGHLYILDAETRATTFDFLAQRGVEDSPAIEGGRRVIYLGTTTAP